MVAWIICIGYLAAAAACIYARRVVRIGAQLAEAPPVERRSDSRTGAYEASFQFWTLLALLLVFLGLNKQLDLHVFVTDVGRRVAHAQGGTASGGRCRRQ